MTDSKLKLLILEDVLPDMELTVWHLTEAGYQLDVTHADTELAFSEALQKDTFDIIISDFKLPGFDAFGALEIWRKTCPEVPFICVSGTIGEEIAVELIKKGAIDYVLKDRPARLPFTVQRALNEAKEKEAHRKAEDELRDNETQLKAVFEHSNDGIILIDDQGVIVKTNHQTELTTGLNKDKLIGSYFWEIQHQLLLPELKQSFSIEKLKEMTLKRLSALADDEIIKQESTILNANNESKLVEDFVRPLQIKNKRFYYVSQLDITERKKAEKSQHIAFTKYKALFDSFPLGVTISDNKGNIVESNLVAEELLGLSESEQMNRKIGGAEWKLIQNDGTLMPAEAYASVRALNENRKIENVEMGIVKPNSEVTWINVTAAPIPLENYGVVITYGEITEKKKAEKLLEQAKEKAEENNAINLSRLHLIQYSYNHSIDELLEETINIAEKHTKSNIGFIHFVAADQQNLILKNWSTQTKAIFCKAQGKGEHYSIDKAGVWVDCVRLRKPVIHNDYNALPHKKGLPEGHAHIERQMVVPVIMGNTVKAILGVGNKNSDYTKEDVESLSLLAYLTWEIIERKTALTELNKAKEKAEESDKLKTAFIQNISHEIRTPLNGILGFGQLMTEADLSEEERLHYLEHINQSSNRLINTVSDYMDMARIVSNSIEVNKKVFEVKPFIDSITEKTKNLCSNRKIKFEVKVPADMVRLTIDSDPEFIEIILNKLLDNAVKFTQEGSIACGYSIKNGYIEFFVQDTGCGIDNNKLDLIFQMFSQADLSLTRGHEGSGLGLTIARGFASILGGDIKVASVKGKGSVFTFTIPFENTEKTFSHINTNSAIKTHHKKPIILIAEDDESNYEYLKIALKIIGHNHIRAINGAEAINKCREYPEISMVLMDIKMPVIHGDEAAKQIRVFRPELPIIATTSYAITGDEQRFLEAGCNDYLAKPIKKEKLIALIKKYIG